MDFVQPKQGIVGYLKQKANSSEDSILIASLVLKEHMFEVVVK